MRYSLADIQERMFNRPVAITRQKAEIILGAMGPRLHVSSLVVAGEEGRTRIGDLAARAAEERSAIESRPGDEDLIERDWDTGAILDPYEVWNGVAVMKVRGTLMAEGGLHPRSGMTSYEGLDYKLRHARADSRVRGLVYDIDSGGGEVVDLLEFCRHLREARDQFPIRAIVRGMACSAAYAIASCADEITCAPYSWTGSIGAVIAHADFSKQLQEEGVTVTLIASAPHKTDASEFIPLETEVRAKLQAEVDQAAATFINHVAEARSVSADEIAAQEARFYNGGEALDLRLVDKIMPWDDSLKEFAEAVNRRQPSAATPAPSGTAASANRGATRMDRGNLAPAATDQPEFTQETQIAAVAAAQTAERARIGQLLELDAGSTASPALSAAIGAGTSAGDFAIELQRASNQQRTDALASARSDSVKGSELPEQRSDTSASTQKPNRGLAAVERMRGQHKGLPAQG
jgi:signal peptide peptidase SppA